MAATKVQLNWTSVSFASTAITRVTSVQFSQGGELIEFAGDNDRFPTVIANNMNRPKCSIASADVANLMNITPGTIGTINATQKDALASSGGDIIWTLANGVHETTDDTGQFSQFASGTATFRSFSSDGATNPLSFTRA
jgi:hypothetical protein